MKKISFANSKGGVGKTTLTLSLINILASLDKKVLVFDLDPQRNLTKVLMDENKDENFLEKWFTEDSNPTELVETIKETNNENISIVPGWSELANKMLTKLDQSTFGEIVFSKNLEKVKVLNEVFDYIFFDTSPKADKLLTSMLLACDSIIVPIEPHIFSYQGIEVMVKPYEKAIEIINGIGGNLKNNIKYFVLNKVKKAKVHQVMLEVLGREKIHDKLLTTVVSDSISRQQETIVNNYKINEKNPIVPLFQELLEKGIL